MFLSTGNTWEQLVQKRLLRPLRMNSTGFVDLVDDYTKIPIALPCAIKNGTFYNLSPELLRYNLFHGITYYMCVIVGRI